MEIRQVRPTPPVFGAHVGVNPFEFWKDFGHHKTRVPGLCGVVCVILGVATLKQYRLVTDKRTDTRRQLNTELAWHRAVKILQKLLRSCSYMICKKAITLVSSCGRFPVLWTNDWQAHLTFLVNVWMIDLCLERNLWRLEGIFSWKIYPHTECTFVVWRTLLYAVHTP